VNELDNTKGIGMYRNLDNTKGIGMYRNSESYRQRGAIVEEIREIKTGGREVIHLTVNWNQIQYNNNPELMCRIFGNWYVCRFLPWLMNTRYFTKSKIAYFQPITKVYLENHYQSNKVAMFHHHAIVLCHKTTMSKMNEVLGKVIERKHKHQLTAYEQIQSVELDLRNPEIALYDTKQYEKWKDYSMNFPKKIENDFVDTVVDGS